MAIDKAFGDFHNFYSIFVSTTRAVKGKGWCWLAYNIETGGLEIKVTPNEELLIERSPEHIPLLTIDVWVND